MVPMGRTQELLGGVFAPAHSKSQQEKTSSSLQAPRGAASIAHTKEQHLPVPILLCWKTASAPSGLLFLPSLASSTAASETHQHSRAASHTHQPQAVIPRNGMSCGKHPLEHTQGREDGEQRMESDQHISVSFRFLDPKSFLVGPLLFPSPPTSRDTMSSWEARLAQPLHETLLPVSWPGAIWSPGTPGIPVLCRSRNGTAPRSPPYLVCSCGGSWQQRKHLPCCDT